MGLGSGTLADARGKAAAARALLNNNQDPLAKAKTERLAKAAEVASTTTFKQAATRFIADNKSGWKNAKHAAQWPRLWKRMSTRSSATSRWRTSTRR